MNKRIFFFLLLKKDNRYTLIVLIFASLLKVKTVNIFKCKKLHLNKLSNINLFQFFINYYYNLFHFHKKVEEIKEVNKNGRLLSL